MRSYSRDFRTAEKAAQSVFTWLKAERQRYDFCSSTDVVGSLAVSLEPSVLFSPKQCQYYKAKAETGGKRYHFNCFFLQNSFRGCALTPDNDASPLALYQEGSEHFRWCSHARIILNEDGSSWQWNRGQHKGEWIVRDASRRLLEIESEQPEVGGMIRLCSPAFLQRIGSRALMLFFIYLAMGPKRPIPSGF
ncbi:MAG TPA: hypothetical protein VMU17_04460 [Elusimicrobiota bacterium]|nr:hypothetical protein [Elusimicrobiota bacterium]